jgi:hypothetical protein
MLPPGAAARPSGSPRRRRGHAAWESPRGVRSPAVPRPRGSGDRSAPPQTSSTPPRTPCRCAGKSRPRRRIRSRYPRPPQPARLRPARAEARETPRIAEVRSRREEPEVLRWVWPGGLVAGRVAPAVGFAARTGASICPGLSLRIDPKAGWRSGRTQWTDADVAWVRNPLSLRHQTMLSAPCVTAHSRMRPSAVTSGTPRSIAVATIRRSAGSP